MLLKPAVREEHEAEILQWKFHDFKLLLHRKCKQRIQIKL